MCNINIDQIHINTIFEKEMHTGNFLVVNAFNGLIYSVKPVIKIGRRQMFIT